MSRRPGRISGDGPVAVGAALLFVIYVWLLTRATVPVVTTLAFASDTRPKLYAGLLALLIGLPGCLLTLPRALASPPPRVQPTVRARHQMSARRQSHLKTDLLGIAALLFAQVPLPAPWGPAGKAATIANITKSAEIVELSARLANWSIGIFGIGVLAAIMVRIYSHAAAFRVLGIALVVGFPVVSWFVLVRSI
ncbi:hypothetical protein [Intrasporangium sp. DVR]|uniref:hypothetical protein n=1 Tax=Intrasporangium sp. DVR TaxID=3127867 RepID=UPI00333FCC45